MISDEMAYRRIWTAREQAADLLVERYGDPLVYYLHGYLQDLHEAEDLMIEAFSQLFAKPSIDGAGSFKAYLYKTACNLARATSGNTASPSCAWRSCPLSHRATGLADTELLRSERDRQLYAALEQLKAEYREALYLVYWEDMSYRSAAAVMGKSVQQVTNLVHRGKKSLKGILERERFDHADE